MCEESYVFQELSMRELMVVEVNMLLCFAHIQGVCYESWGLLKVMLSWILFSPHLLSFTIRIWFCLRC